MRVQKAGLLGRVAADAMKVACLLTLPCLSPLFSVRLHMAILSEPNGYFWHIACITKVHEGKSKRKKLRRKEQTDESQDEHEGRQRTVGQLS
jgi:hypothetical protein